MDETLRVVRTTPELRSAAIEGSLTFEELFESESRTLFRRLWLITGNRAEAEEIAQDAFLKVWERWESVRTLEDPTGYLYRTAMNVFRRRYQRALLAGKRIVGIAPDDDDFSRSDERQAVRQVLGTLKPRQRAALVLTELLGFSSEEAGRALGVRASTVRALAFQGRAAFKKRVEAEHE